MKRTRVILALLMALLMLGGLFMAVADEGPGTMDVSPGGEDEPPVEADPTDPPIEPTDTPADPTEPPVDPTDAPTDEPTEEPTDAPTEEPTDTPTEEPSTEPSEEPTPEPPSDNNYAGGSDPDQGSATSPGLNMGGSIRQPSSGGLRRPVSTASPSSQEGGSSQSSSGGGQAPVDDGPQYVTFARVTQKSNAMARTLFYSGAACVGTGALGLIVLLVFIIRGRNVDDREEIFAEIQQASVRQPVRPRQFRQDQAYEDDPYAQYDRQDRGGYGDYGRGGYDGQGYDRPAPPLNGPEPEELAVPVNGSVYTEEFELPPQQGDYEPEEPSAPVSMYTEEFEPPRPAPRAAAPRRASMYTEEFSLSEEMSQPPADRQYAARRPAQPARRPERRAQAPRPRPAAKVSPDQMDTTELLREILYGEEDKK